MGITLENPFVQASRTWLSLLSQPAALFSRSGRLLEYNEAFGHALMGLYQTRPRPGVFWSALITNPKVSEALHRFFRVPGSSQGGETQLSLGGPGLGRVYRVAWRPLVASDSRLTIALTASEVSDALTVELDLVSGAAFLSLSLCALLERDLARVAFDWESQIHPEDRKAVLRAVQELAQEPWSYRLKTEAGGWRWFSAQGRVVQWTPAGSPSRIRIVHEDITRVKRLEQALSETEVRWDSVVTGAPVGIALISPQGKVLFTNGRMETFLPSTSVGHLLTEVVNGPMQSKFDRALRICFSAGNPVTLTSSWNLIDSGAMTIEHILGPVKGADGVQGAVLFSFDTTERARWERHTAREALVQEFLLGLHDQNIDNTEGLSVLTLEAALELTASGFGFIAVCEKGEFRVVALLPSATEGPAPPWSVPDLGPWTSALQRDQPSLLEGTVSLFPPLGAMGSEILHSLGIPVYQDGKPVGLVVVGQRSIPFGEEDALELRSLIVGAWQVIDRKRMEQSNRLLFQALEFVPVSVVITDPVGTIEYVNQHFSTLMGFTPIEAVGSSMALISSGIVPSETMAELETAIRAGRSWTGELINKKKDGQLLWESVSVTPVRGLGGSVGHFVSIQEDITEKRRSQDALLQARKMESVGQLAAGVAHDFNNLLSSLLAMNEMLLLKLPAGDPLRVFPERIGVAGRRAADLVCSLLAFGRRQRLRQEVMNLRDLLREEAGLLESMLRGEAILRTFLDGEPLMVDIDAGQISQVVMNLVSNARDAMEDGGTITLGTGLRPLPGSPDSGTNWAFFTVRDDGPGIPDEIRERIFEPFFTTKDIGKGTGLGLSVVQGIVEQHHGQIVLESAPGNGALFTVYLPLAPPELPVLVAVD